MKAVKRGSLLLAVVLLFALLGGMLVSCDTDSRTVIPFVGSSDNSGSTTPYVTDVKIESGSIIVCYSDGSCVNIGSSVTNVTNNQIDQVTIAGENSGSTAFAVARAQLSTVQVVCRFTKTRTVYKNAGWGRLYPYEEEYSATSAGSGVIYALNKEGGDAYIITNQHVVYDSESKASDHVSHDISIYLCGSTEAITATYVGGVSKYDIAVLRVENSAVLKASAAEAATLANSSALSVGSTALVVGNPEGEGIAATAGIVSVDSETIWMTPVDSSESTVGNSQNNNLQSFRVIRVDAAVNSGNSGGGLYNEKGELIGIVNAKIVSDSVENIGYAIPSNVAVAVAQNLIDNGGAFRRAVLGIEVESGYSRMVYDEKTGRVSIVETVTVVTVDAGGAGEAIGLAVGDTLLSVKVGERDQIDVTRLFHITDEMLNARVGDTVTVTVRRNGTEMTLTGTVDNTWLEQN